MTTFGPQLLGETEKTLGALLRRLLADTGLTEPQWVTLRLAAQNDAGAELAELVARRAHFPDAADLVESLTARHLLDGDRLSPGGREVVSGVQKRITEMAGPIWQDLPPDDVAATERTLNTVVARAREVLG